MIDDFYDEENDRIISLKNMSSDEAVRFLISLKVKQRKAVRHVEESLKKHCLGSLSVEQAAARLEQAGYRPPSMDTFLYSYVYDQLEVNYPDNYPVLQIVFKSYFDNHRAELSFATDTAFSLQTLISILIPRNQRIFPPKQVFHDEFTCFNKIPPIYRITIYFKDDIATIISVIQTLFDKLSALKAVGQHAVNYHEAKEKCFEFARKYCEARDLGFPGGNYYIRTAVPINLALMRQDKQDEKDLNDEPSLQMIPLSDAITSRNAYQVQIMLRINKIKPNRLFFGSSSLLAYVFPHEDKSEKATPEALLTIFALLLEYGVLIDRGFNHGKGLASLIFEAFRCKNNPRQFAIFQRMILMMMRIDNGRTYSYFTPQQLQTNPLARLVYEGQHLVERSRSPSRALLEPTLKGTVKYRLLDKVIFQLSSMKYFNDQRSEFTIETHYLADVLDDPLLIASLYNLFKSHQWSASRNEDVMKKYFFDIMLNVKGDVYIDLIKYRNLLIAFNLAEMIPTDNEKIIFHHVKLALIHEKFSACKGLMFFVSHIRGFLSLIQQSSEKIITVFEAASLASILAIWFFDYFPKSAELNEHLGLLKKTVYFDESQNLELVQDKVDEQPVWRVKDELARFEHKPDPSRWLKPSGIAAHNFFSRRMHRQGESLIVMYENNQTNYKQFQSVLAENIKIPEQVNLFRTAPVAKI